MLCTRVLALAGGGLALHFHRKLQRKERLDALTHHAEDAFRGGRFAEALPARLALKGGPGDRPALALQRAISLREVGRFEEAEVEFAAYLAAQPGDGSAWRHRGLAALAIHDVDLAVRSCREDARKCGIAPALQAEQNGDFDAMIARIERHFLAKEPQHERPWMAAYDPEFFRPNQSGKWLQPDTFPHRSWYGLEEFWPKLIRAGRPERQTIRAEGLIRKHGAHPVLLSWRALDGKSDPAKALAETDGILRMIPFSRGLRYFRLRLLLLLDRCSEAEREHERIRILAPWDLHIRFNLTFVRKEAREFAAARDLFESAALDLLEKRVPRNDLVSAARRSPGTSRGRSAASGVSGARPSRTTMLSGVSSGSRRCRSSSRPCPASDV